VKYTAASYTLNYDRWSVYALGKLGDYMAPWRLDNGNKQYEKSAPEGG